MFFGISFKHVSHVVANDRDWDILIVFRFVFSIFYPYDSIVLLMSVLVPQTDGLKLISHSFGG